MRTFAYCAREYRESTMRAAGVVPLTSPPATVTTFDPTLMAGADLLYFKLHGYPGQPFWYGDHWLTAIRASQIREADLAGAVAFVANCYLEPTEPMYQALADAGCRYIVGGAGENYAAPQRVAGADILGRALRVLMQHGASPVLAYRLARLRLWASWPDQGRSDTLKFTLYDTARGA